MKAFIGERPKGFHICHADGNKTNNSLSNLRYDSPKSNWEDYRKNPGGTHNITVEKCPRGHTLDAPNLMPSQARRGWRSCLACSRSAGYVRAHPELAHKRNKLADEYYAAIMEKK